MPKSNYQKVLSLEFDIVGAAAACGLHRDDVQKLVLEGLVSPSARPSPGRGGPSHARKFAPADIHRLRAIAPLYEAGLPPRYIRRVMDLLSRHRIDVPKDGALIVSGTEAFFVDPKRQAFDVLRQFQGAFYLFLDLERKPMAPGLAMPAKRSRRKDLPPLRLVPVPGSRARSR